jgi:hypothetical protein
MKRILIPSLLILTLLLLVGCNLTGSTPESIEPTATFETTPEPTTNVQVEPTSVPLPDNLIAYYPFTSDLIDLTRNNSPATASYGNPLPDGIFCNSFCDVTTAALDGFDINAFTIRVEFLEPKFPVFRDTVFVGGEYRWARYILLPDGTVALGYNNEEAICSVNYQINVWHEAVITYDGTTLNLYLDGIQGCSVATSLETGGGVNYITMRDNGYGSSFIGIVKNLQVFNTAQVPQVRTPLPGDVSLTDPTLTPADLILSSCPTEAELAAIDADLTLTFESDPAAGNIVCSSSAGSRDLSGFQRIVYTTLLVMKQLEFTQPLPWTDKNLYAWFTDSINGLRFRSDIGYSSCCDPAGVINIQTNDLAVNDTNKWIDPQITTGALDLLVLFVHEARHSEFGGHTCGSNDNTRAEMGPWGVQYYLEVYLANNLKDPSFLTIPDPHLATYYSDLAAIKASQVLFSSFCQDE